MRSGGRDRALPKYAHGPCSCLTTPCSCSVPTYFSWAGFAVPDLFRHSGHLQFVVENLGMFRYGGAQSRMICSFMMVEVPDWTALDRFLRDEPYHPASRARARAGVSRRGACRRGLLGARHQQHEPRASAAPGTRRQAWVRPASDGHEGLMIFNATDFDGHEQVICHEARQV